MKLFEIMRHYQRLAYALTGMLIMVGIASWFTMARQEDPSFPQRAGLIKVVFPGVTAGQIEKLITEPLEEQLTEVEELRSIKSTSRDDVVLVVMQLQDRIYDTDAAWDRVRRAMEKAERDFPQGVVEFSLDDQRVEIPAVVISVVGSGDIVSMAEQAEKLKKQLLHVAGVSRIEINGDPEKELRIELDNNTLNQLGINRDQVVAAIQTHNKIIPGGLIRTGNQGLRIASGSDLQHTGDIEAIPIALPNGQRIPLHALGKISIAPKEPKAAQSYHKGARAVSLGIFLQRGQVDSIKFGVALRERLDSVREQYAPLKIEEIFFQPDFVADRLSGLQLSLLGSISIIALAVVFALGWRNGLMVASVVPVVAIIALAIYSIGGGVLHQIAVIGVVISLGILVDNAIVVVEAIEQGLQQGLNRKAAVKEAVAKMAFPLFTSTGTTVAAFIPLLLSKGGTGDFTRGVPVMIILSLIISYIISVLVLPLLAEHLVRERVRKKSRFLEYTSEKLVSISRYHAGKAMIVGLAALVLTLALLPMLKLQFFPSADRDQVYIDITLPGDATLERTLTLSSQVEEALLERIDVSDVFRSVGMTGFRFYYNLDGVPDSTNLARLMVNTTGLAANQHIIDWVEDTLQPRFPEATLIAKKLGQGPPSPAPVEIRLIGQSQSQLFKAADQVKAILARAPGTHMIRDDLDTGIAEFSVRVENNTAQELGISNEQVATGLFGQSRGLNAGEYRYGDDPITIRIRSDGGDHTQAEELRSLYLYDENGDAVPLDAVAEVSAQWSPAVIHHYGGQRSVTMLSELLPGAAYNEVLAALDKELEHQPLPDGVELELGGDAEGSSKANNALLKTAPLGIMLLLFFMLLQFNSFRRLGIILTTIPLSAMGIIPGLFLSGQPFGFQSLLGVIALIGIVVNNAIVLLDLVDARLAEGVSVDEAVAQSIRERTAPILLTTATTVLGLLPLALSASTLWPPMAWAIISGLMMSTLLTLVFIPVLCRVLLTPSQSLPQPGVIPA
ncbi:efflux RND transporter permease subunit [Ketobacter sp. MCCC 1A13808]|uniref:efflux RND transporter permease subunit n=1 Tax=Ketobacter sp. MCCC 1A13808 TaxID=2602738 RepID=UPI000F24BE2C|nr:efflux RND transporter permease subunit [Ketobacter sp. MCCC 1A13808]MVF12178.1 efflux RND transporter permease subunit [Ketobacter sp. MCCC 1A13808]RLP53720.1 MAG: efflux RND transporter permease subunit [Ketobacter sp.]